MEKDRLPALRLTDIRDPYLTKKEKMDKCFATWDKNVPVRCGSDATRYLVAKLGARGLSDRDSWPALDANNATATTAVVELFQLGGAEVRVRCSPRWIRRDGSEASKNPFQRPVVRSALVTQTGEPFFVSHYRICSP